MAWWVPASAGIALRYETISSYDGLSEVTRSAVASNGPQFDDTILVSLKLRRAYPPRRQPGAILLRALFIAAAQTAF
jgi:hypothetical protein